MQDATERTVEFLKRFASALGIETPIDVEQTADGPRLNMSGEQAELLVRHRGEPLKALQHVVDMAYGRTFESDQRVFVDALAYRKGKDLELRQMAVLRLVVVGLRCTAVNQPLGSNLRSEIPRNGASR